MPATIETNTAPRPITVPERMIGYTIVDSPLSLGRLLVGATSRGVCAVRLGRSDAALEAALAREHPDMELRRDGAPLAPWVNTLLRHLAGRAARLDLPLDVEATAFQQRVWQALRAIPYGETRSYGAVAEAVGHPGAARAVARACAANPVALVIPCHRVVRGDGDPGGYRWGVARKRLLLEQERSAAQLAERRGTLPLEATVVIGKQLCRALDVVHGQGVIHRDLKPQNVLLTRGGEVKLTDFGIAELDRPPSLESATAVPRGTLAYMAPEQLLGEPIDARTDLYATAAVLCECLTGSPPYPATTPESLLARALTGGPPLVAGPLGDLLRCALSAHGGDRPATAAAFHDALAEVAWSTMESPLA